MSHDDEQLLAETGDVDKFDAAIWESIGGKADKQASRYSQSSHSSFFPGLEQ
ncbi:hypothetical protein [Fischerella sp. JS2]|uniref:hypothetical protein n=1 Tax=Fischerella sp. JS2 TaxID=2597771 RepID=UPI0028EC5AEB|nr:hypothetical protein [Fischerella sp. JS2]